MAKEIKIKIKDLSKTERHLVQKGANLLQNADKKKNELKQRFGIKCMLNKKRKFFNYREFILNINSIENLGDFLIMEGEEPSKEIIEKDLEINYPEYIKKSFDEMFIERKN